ncbi:histidinol dehydrogenase [Candidatus Neomarinimicrobiota bacterium]
MISLPIFSNPEQLAARLKKRQELDRDLDVVKPILHRVRNEGDAALRQCTEEFDGLSLTELTVSRENLAAAVAALDNDLRSAIQGAAENIRRFHAQQYPSRYSLTQPDGTEVAWDWRPLKRVGVYIPGGRYPLLSTVLMNIIPAQVAGVERIIVCTPPGPEGDPDTALLGVCGLLGVEEVYRVGGAQAVAAMAYGTDTIPAVDKITGPGNRYVTAAKYVVSATVGIDMLAGPTEVVILADGSAEPSLVAADLIAQAEHDPEAWCILVTDSINLAEAVNVELQEQSEDLSTRDMIAAALTGQGFIYLGRVLEQCIEVVNRIAPEHLCLQVAAPDELVKQVQAGAIFIGSLTPVAWGDYWAGPNHTLPTAGQARFRGPLSVMDFLVPFSVVNVSEQAAKASGDQVQLLARQEGLVGHARSIALRKPSHE